MLLCVSSPLKRMALLLAALLVATAGPLARAEIGHDVSAAQESAMQHHADCEEMAMAEAASHAPADRDSAGSHMDCCDEGALLCCPSMQADILTLGRLQIQQPSIARAVRPRHQAMLEILPGLDPPPPRSA